MNDPLEHLITDDEMERMADRALGLEPLQDDRETTDAAKAADQAFARLVRDSGRGAAAIVVNMGDAPSAVNAAVTRKKKAFLMALAKTGIPGVAASRAGWTLVAARNHRKTDETFAMLWDEALDFAGDVVEMEMHRRGISGVKKDIYHKGIKCGEEVVYSDRMLEMLAKARRPEKFRESYKVDADVKGGVLIIPQQPSAEDWAAQAAAGQEQYRSRQD